jgi:hypothetical protein
MLTRPRTTTRLLTQLRTTRLQLSTIHLPGSKLVKLSDLAHCYFLCYSYYAEATYTTTYATPTYNTYENNQIADPPADPVLGGRRDGIVSGARFAIVGGSTA